MTRSRVLAVLGATVFVVAACEDDSLNRLGPTGRGSFDRYVSMGTSVSMGVRNGSNAITAETQIGAWPSLLARQAGAANFRLPLVRPGGCFSPSIAPLSLGINLAGRPQASPLTPDTICAGGVAGIILPTNNVAITGHKALDALTQTPESAAINRTVCSGSPQVCTTDLARRKILPLVLLPKQTQVTAMLSQRPTFVSVELGANDVLGIVSGIVIVGATITPEADFIATYTKIIDSVKKTGAKAVLIGLPSAIESAAALRTGAELHADSLTFALGFRVTIASDCKTTNAANYIFVPARVFLAIGTARAVGSATLSCANAPPTVQDGVLSPADIALANSAIAGYNTAIQSLATANGYAYATLDGWFLKPKPAFSVQQLLTSTMPYGKFFGLDGVHPTQAGQIEIANSAITAINARYRFEIPALPTPTP